MLFLLLPLLSLLPINFGTLSQPIYLSPSRLPALPSIARKNSPEHASLISISASITPFIAARRHHYKYTSAAPAPSPPSRGKLGSPNGSTLPKRRHHSHRTRSSAVSPSLSATPGCSHVCAEPLTSAPFGSPCACVIPMKVRLRLGVAVNAIYQRISQLELEVAAGTYLKQSQVEIIGAAADINNEERTVVDIFLVPLGEKFDNTTAILTYQRFLHKKVPLNQTLFGGYDVLEFAYPGLPSSPPPGTVKGPNGSVGNKQDPITADLVGKTRRLSTQTILAIVLSAFVLSVVFCAAVVILFKYRKTGIPSNAVGPAFTPSVYKRSGKPISSGCAITCLGYNYLHKFARL